MWRWSSFPRGATSAGSRSGAWSGSGSQRTRRSGSSGSSSAARLPASLRPRTGSSAPISCARTDGDARRHAARTVFRRSSGPRTLPAHAARHVAGGHARCARGNPMPTSGPTLASEAPTLVVTGRDDPAVSADDTRPGDDPRRERRRAARPAPAPSSAPASSQSCRPMSTRRASRAPRGVATSRRPRRGAHDRLHARVPGLITRYAWGRSGPAGLNAAAQCMTLVALVALGRFEELELHVRTALRNGLTPDEIKEVLLHTTVYCGVPRRTRLCRRPAGARGGLVRRAAPASRSDSLAVALAATVPAASAPAPAKSDPASHVLSIRESSAPCGAARPRLLLASPSIASMPQATESRCRGRRHRRPRGMAALWTSRLSMRATGRDKASPVLHLAAPRRHAQRLRDL